MYKPLASLWFTKQGQWNTHMHGTLSLPCTRALLQVVLEPVDVTPDRPLPNFELKRPGYEADSPVEAVLVVVAGNCDTCVLQAACVHQAVVPQHVVFAR